MKRLVPRVLGVYLLYAIVGRAVERVGTVACGCDPSCWCKRPVLNNIMSV